MIRSRHHNVTLIDKALYLWTLCTIEWMHERQEPISNNNLDRLFGELNKKRFNTYREIAMEFKHLAHDGLTLTPPGQRIVDSWRRFSERIYEVD
jgi:hypothetical protein